MSTSNEASKDKLEVAKPEFKAAGPITETKEEKYYNPLDPENIETGGYRVDDIAVKVEGQDNSYQKNDEKTDFQKFIERQRQANQEPTPRLTPWQQYIRESNEKYQAYLDELSKQKFYKIDIPVDDPQADFGLRSEYKVYQRAIVRFWQMRELEQLREEASDLLAGSKEREKATGDLYIKTATYYLWDQKERRFITEKEVKMAEWTMMRTVIDACMYAGTNLKK